jgi:hypothetical protein
MLKCSVFSVHNRTNSHVLAILSQHIAVGVLAVGGILVVGFAYLFGLENTLVHNLMVSALALLISSVLFSIGVLEYPFSGDVRVSPEAFELVLERFERSKLSEL